LALLGAVGTPAQAQPATPPAAINPSTGSGTPKAAERIEEITVTSQKRKENVRKVPLSVTVLSGAQIRAAHIENFADLTRSVPNLSFSSQAGEGLSNLEIRGISSSAGTATVALYLDDVSLTTRNLPTEGASEPRFLDISRIEVLRGPQSTLYGASALGGTLRYISNAPVMNQFSGNLFSELSGTYHGSVNWDEQGVVNIPIVDNQLVLRLAGETGSDSGYINNINPNDGSVIKGGINSTAFDVVKGTLLWTPTDWLSITPSAFFQRFDQRDSDAQYLELPHDQTPKLVAEPGRDTLVVPAVTFNADLGFANLIAAICSTRSIMHPARPSTAIPCGNGPRKFAWCPSPMCPAKAHCRSPGSPACTIPMSIPHRPTRNSSTTPTRSSPPTAPARRTRMC
jgi:outer membrane receptor protein involved in Fe transport